MRLIAKTPEISATTVSVISTPGAMCGTYIVTPPLEKAQHPCWRVLPACGCESLKACPSLTHEPVPARMYRSARRQTIHSWTHLQNVCSYDSWVSSFGIEQSTTLPVSCSPVTRTTRQTECAKFATHSPREGGPPRGCSH